MSTSRNKARLAGFDREGPNIVVAGCIHGEPCGECEACEATVEFTRQACEICGTTLAGSRYSVAKIFPGTRKDPIYYSVCEYCLMFAAYGDLFDPNDD